MEICINKHTFKEIYKLKRLSYTSSLSLELAYSHDTLIAFLFYTDGELSV